MCSVHVTSSKGQNYKNGEHVWLLRDRVAGGWDYEGAT